MSTTTPMRAGVVALAVLGVSLTATRASSAQSLATSHCPNLAGEKSGGLEWKRPPIRNTVGYRTMTNAILSNSQAYGAVRMAEQRLLPMLMSPGGKSRGGALDLDATLTAGAVRLPLCPGQGEGETPVMGSVDLSAVNIGFGFRWSRVGFFLATSVAAHTVYSGTSASQEFLGRVASAWALPLMAISYFPVGLIKTEYYRENLSVVYTHIVGAAVDTPVGPLTAGYASTKGFFTNFSGTKIPLFASALLATRLEEVPYLAGGLTTLRRLASNDYISKIGDTSLFARRLQYVGLAPTGVSTREVGGQNVGRTNFVTQHLEQTGIADKIDVTIVTTTAPQPNLYEATLGFHTDGYRSVKSLMNQIENEPADPKNNNGGFAVSAGVVRLPDLWYYGVEGGYRFKAAVKYTRMIEGSGVMSFGVAVNDTEVLSVFPYAYNAPQFSALLAGAFR